MAFIFKLWYNWEYSHIFLKYLKILLFSVKDQTRSSSIIFVFVFQLFLFDLFKKKIYITYLCKNSGEYYKLILKVFI